MTTAELLAREILRLDARGGRDTEREPGFDDTCWPTGEAVRVALHIVAETERIDRYWAGRRAA
jgi:hypothetical protein